MISGVTVLLVVNSVVGIAIFFWCIKKPYLTWIPVWFLGVLITGIPSTLVGRGGYNQYITGVITGVIVPMVLGLGARLLFKYLDEREDKQKNASVTPT